MHAPLILGFMISFVVGSGIYEYLDENNVNGSKLGLIFYALPIIIGIIYVASFVHVLFSEFTTWWTKPLEISGYLFFTTTPLFIGIGKGLRD